MLLDLAFGAEYFLTPSFSLGAEVLGLRFAYSEGDYNVSGFGGNSQVTAKNMYLTFYTGISLNYRFGIAGTGPLLPGLFRSTHGFAFSSGDFASVS